MKLSAAIREGSKLRPMATEDYFIFPDDDSEPSSCALGAAYEALGCEPSCIGVDCALYNKWPILRQAWMPQPPMGLITTLLEVIAIMNDSGMYTREEIADWLESIDE